MPDSSILLFIKSPEPGKVKSRLASAIGEESALDIYRAFVLDIVGTLKKGNRSITIAFYSEDAEAVVNWLGKDLVYIPQKGKDLGARMRNAFHDVLSQGHEKAVLVGSDIPDLPFEIIDEAFSALEEKDAVIGPASDGGYFLIGFKKDTFLPDIFHGIAWSTDSVYRETMKVFERAGHRVHILPEWRDVDTLDDLRSLYMRNRNTGFRDSLTMSSCKKVFHD
jgi:rSAM/selenodomain-associated transferase 1